MLCGGSAWRWRVATVRIMSVQDRAVGVYLAIPRQELVPFQPLFGCPLVVCCPRNACICYACPCSGLALLRCLPCIVLLMVKLLQAVQVSVSTSGLDCAPVTVASEEGASLGCGDALWS